MKIVLLIALIYILLNCLTMIWLLKKAGCPLEEIPELTEMSKDLGWTLKEAKRGILIAGTFLAFPVWIITMFEDD